MKFYLALRLWPVFLTTMAAFKSWHSSQQGMDLIDFYNAPSPYSAAGVAIIGLAAPVLSYFFVSALTGRASMPGVPSAAGDAAPVRQGAGAAQSGAGAVTGPARSMAAPVAAAIGGNRAPAARPDVYNIAVTQNVGGRGARGGVGGGDTPPQLGSGGGSGGSAGPAGGSGSSGAKTPDGLGSGGGAGGQSGGPTLGPDRKRLGDDDGNWRGRFEKGN
jgi:hypothetical protein